MPVETLMLLCVSILSSEPMPERKLATLSGNCVELAAKAEDYGHDPLMVIAIGHTESRFKKRAKSGAGAVGMMQVLPKYYCPRSGRCDYTEAGLLAWKKWKAITWKGVPKTIRNALCGYNSGSHCAKNHRARVYANVVLRKYRRLKAIIRKE